MLLLQAVGIGLAVGIAVALVGVVIYLTYALAKMGGIAAMQWRDLFSLDRWTEVMVTIGRSKLRTALTLISVAWGIFVLVFLLGLGHGLNQGTRNQFAREAVNSVWMVANKTSKPHDGYDLGRRITFENRDYDAARTVAGIDHISGEFDIGRSGSLGSRLTKRGAKANAFDVNAVHADAYYIDNVKLSQGRFLNALDITQARKTAVVGGAMVDFLFEKGEDPLGEWIEVAGVPFQVVGVFRDPQGPEQERQLFIPVSTAQLAFNGNDKLHTLFFTAGELRAEETKAIIAKITAQLSERHRFAPDDVQAVRVFNNVEQFERFSMLFFMTSVFVVVIGLGTLAAGVVGVSNIMMIAVKERTKEIGIRKALGATPASVIFMVIQESVFLTAIAGLLGLAGGVGLLSLVEHADTGGFILNPSIDLTTGVAATLFLVVAGALAGYFPARAAARVNPIHALRDQ